MQQLLQDHGDPLVPEEVGHHVEVERPHKALVETSDAGEGVSQLFGAVEEIHHTRAFGRGLPL